MDRRFEILDKMFRGTKDLVSHHQDSYQRFLVYQIPRILKEISPIKIPLVRKTKTGIVSDETGEGVMRKEDAVFAEEDRIDADTYEGFESVVSIFFGGKTGESLNIYKPIRYLDDDKKVPLLPNEARLRGLSYMSTITTDITVRILNLVTGEARETVIEDLPIINVPIMLRSSACWLYDMTPEALMEAGEDPDDPGGYFIMDGAERVLITQERVIPNLPYVNSVPEVMMACSEPDSSKVKILRLSFGKRGIVASVPGTKGLVPVGVLFRALGVISDQEIVRCIFNTDTPDEEEVGIIRETLASSHGIYDMHTAYRLLTHVSRAVSLASAHGIIHKFLFSQQTGGLPEKAALLGYLVKMLVHRKLGRIQDTDRDSMQNKSLAISGTLMGEIFSNIIATREEEIRKKISSTFNYNYAQYEDDRIFDLASVIVRLKDTIFNEQENTSLLRRSMKGQWGADPARGIPTKIEGVSQALDRLTYLSSLSHLRRVVLERVPQGKALLARRLHMSSYGYICPSETPSGGPKIGVVKNLAILASVSSGVSASQIRDLLYKLGVRKCKNVDYLNRKGMYRVCLNGVLLGFTNTPDSLHSELLSMRRRGLIHHTISLSVNRINESLWISCGPGRLLRPLIRVKDGKPMIEETLKRLVESERLDKNVYSGIPFEGNSSVREGTGDIEEETPIELLDPWEIENLYIANYEEEITDNHTHIEVHPSTIFGIMGCLIPFAPHNQGPRNIYSCAQSKQGTSVYSKAFMSRYDHSAMVLMSPQKPIVSTWYGRKISSGMLSYGTNLIVAIACFTGYNQEDGVLVNRTSVERGLFRVLKFTEESSEEENSKDTKTKIRFSDPRVYPGIKLKEKADYSYLDEDGFLPEGTVIGPNMVLFGRVAEQEGETPKDVSILAGKFSGGVVDSKVIIRNTDGLRRVRYKIAKLRSPELGDKFSSRAGQKGTNGMLINQVDMPRTTEGIVPDLVVNPHAIPSRMTIGQLQESVLSKVASLIGTEMDSTSFTQNGVSIDKITELLKANGYENYSGEGDETMYSGITGERLPTKIFIGPTYYMRLKHMAQDKLNYRDGGVERGPVDARTRQPVAGRGKEGGLRIGEMERDSILSYGASNFLRESLTGRADGEEGIVCATSGKRGFYNEDGYRSVEVDGPLHEGVGETKSSGFSVVSMPRGLNVLLQELETMGIDTRLVTDGGSGRRVRYSKKTKLIPGKDYEIPEKDEIEVIRTSSMSSRKTRKQREEPPTLRKVVVDGIGEKSVQDLQERLDSVKDYTQAMSQAKPVLEERIKIPPPTLPDSSLISQLKEPDTEGVIAQPAPTLPAQPPPPVLPALPDKPPDRTGLTTAAEGGAAIESKVLGPISVTKIE